MRLKATFACRVSSGPVSGSGSNVSPRPSRSAAVASRRSGRLAKPTPSAPTAPTASAEIRKEVRNGRPSGGTGGRSALALSQRPSAMCTEARTQGGGRCGWPPALRRFGAEGGARAARRARRARPRPAFRSASARPAAEVAVVDAVGRDRGFRVERHVEVRRACRREHALLQIGRGFLEDADQRDEADEEVLAIGVAESRDPLAGKERRARATAPGPASG